MFKYLVIALLTLGLNACAPRGETKSLDQVLELARDAYKSSPRSNLVGETGAQIDSLTSKLEQSINSGEDRQASFSETASILLALSSRSGMTSRAALGELASQFRTLSAAEKANITDAQAKLLASRVYHLLAAELNGSSFRL